MKIFIIALAIIASASGDVSHLSGIRSLDYNIITAAVSNLFTTNRDSSTGGDLLPAAQTRSESVVPAPSDTQGPNPQDIATPEPEYIDIDYPFDEAEEPLPKSSPPAPAPQARSAPAPAARSAPAARPAPAPAPAAPAAPAFSTAPNFGQRSGQSYLPPAGEVPGHTFDADGYHYRNPRRFFSF